MKLKNFTPHEIVIMGPVEGTEGEYKPLLRIPPEDHAPLRVVFIPKQRATVEVDGITIPIYQYTYSRVENLPPREDGVMYIVSGIMLDYLPDDRDDFLAPDTDPDSAIRDQEGRIIGVKRFRTAHNYSDYPLPPRF